MDEVVGERQFQMMAAEDQNPVQTFMTYRANEALGERIGSG